jgi:hypothetical protein
MHRLSEKLKKSMVRTKMTKASGKGGGFKAIKINKNKGQDNEYHGGISYRKLNKMILKLHPTDPDTNKKFDIFESVTVSNYLMKLNDACGCITLYKKYKLLKYKVKNFFFPKKRFSVSKPKTMQDVPSSDSADSEANDTFKGLSNASIYLGEGAILYL